MQRLGIIGGIGPESTIAYYRAILRAGKELAPDAGAVPILINSIDVRKLLALAGGNALDELTDYLVHEIDVLANGGATIALLASNTPHIVFDAVQARSPIPLISIVDATRDAVLAAGLTRVGLFGTRFTMDGAFYPAVFSRAGIALVMPNETERTYIHDKYMNELLENVFLDSTRDALTEIVSTMRERDRVQAIVLAGTELPLLLTNATAAGIPLLDTTLIHVRAAVRRTLGQGE